MSLLQYELQKYNIYTRRYFYPLCTEYECYIDAVKSEVEVAERVADEVLCMPFYGELEVSGVEKIIEYELDDSELDQLRRSAQGVAENIAKLKL